MKKFLFIVLCIVLLICGAIFILKKDDFKNSQTDEYSSSNLKNSDEESSKKPVKEDTTFTITALGDVLCHNTQYWDAQDKSTNTYDFNYVFDEVKDLTSSGDITITNLETSFAGEAEGYSNFPIFNSPDSLATALKNIGVDIVSTAGNHALDKGFKGLSRTIDVLEENGLHHLGTYKTEEAQKELLYEDIKGLKVAFIDYTYGTNGIPVPEGKEFCINLIDKNLIKKQIKQAQDENADVIIACMHWGIEYQTSPNSEQKELADFLFKNGVDIIIGNHPHVLESMEKRTVELDDGTAKECFVIYALGNFTADQRDIITRDSIILNLTATKHSNGKLTIDKAEYTPIFMFKNSNATKKFKVLNIQKTLDKYDSGEDTSIGKSNYDMLKTQLTKIKEIVGEEIN